MKRTLAISLLIGTLTGCSIIAELTEQNSPVIETFTVDPEEGYAPLEVLYEWRISDPDGDSVRCTLDYGDSDMTRIGDCDEVTAEFHVYQEPGSYIITLSADDGGGEVRRTAAVVVDENSDGSPEDEDFAITSLIAQPNQGAAPLLSALSWTLQAKGSATCTLSFGDGTDNEVIENCQDVTDAFHTFEDEGGYRVILEATDGETTVRKSLVVIVQPGD